MKPDPTHVSQAERLRLAPIVPQRARMSGERMGSKAGASVEFLDHRPYVFGDDLRKIDWKAYARNDQILIKQFREENRPMARVLLDTSASMRIPEEKGQLALDLAVMMTHICAAQGLDTRLVELDGRSWSPKESMTLEFSRSGMLMDDLITQIGTIPSGALLFLVSDFFSPHDPRILINLLEQRAAMVVLLQVVSQQEQEPEMGGSFLFQDAETGQEVVVDLSEETVVQYKKRVQNLCTGLEEEIFRRGGRYCLLSTKVDFSTACGALIQRDILQAQ